MNHIRCRLPGGYADKYGVIHQDCTLSPLSGREEEFLAEKRTPASASLVTAILSRCIRHVGTISPLTEKKTRNLLVADRQYLLLKLREITFGDQVQATIFCPWPNCGKRVDIDFSLKDIPVRDSEDKGPTYRMTLSPEAALVDDNEKCHREISFRLPIGEDQEIISPHISKNEASALSMLFARCIQSLGSIKSPGVEWINRLTPLARMEIEKHMETVAPRVELTMEAECPECGREFIAPFDLQDFFFGELRISLDLLYREVHYLAYYYHWSEKEIMAMSRDKRHRYIEILADEIERLNNAV